MDSNNRNMVIMVFQPVTTRSTHSVLAPRGLAPTLHLASVMLGCQDTGQPMFGNYHQVPQSECQTCEKCLMMVKVKVPT